MFAFKRAIRVPAPVQVTDTVIEVPELPEGEKVQPVAVPLLVKSDEDRPETVSLKVNVNDDDKPLLAPDDQEAVGAVVSESGTLTETETVPPPSVVCAFPAESEREKDPDAVKDEVTDPPPAVAVDVAFTRQVVELV